MVANGRFSSLMPMRFVRTIMVTNEHVGTDQYALCRGVSVILDHDNSGVVFGKHHHDLRHHEAVDHYHGAYMSRTGHLFSWQRTHAREPDCIQSYYWQLLMLLPQVERINHGLSFSSATAPSGMEIQLS